MSKRIHDDAEPDHCKRHKAIDIDALVHVPDADVSETLLQELTERIIRLEQEKAEYQVIAGRAAQELAQTRSMPHDIVIRFGKQLQEMHEENGRVERRIEQVTAEFHKIHEAFKETKKEHDELRKMSLHEFMSRRSECPVCMEHKRMCVMMPCFHTCCQRCVIKWGKEKPLECPTCKTPVTFTHDFETGLWHSDRW